MIEALGALLSGLAAGTLGGLLGIGGGIVLIPFLRFGVGLAPAYAAGTCVVAVFCTTLSGAYRHHRLGHVRVKWVLPVIVAGVAATVLFSVLFVWLARHEHWLDLGTGLVFSLISGRMIIEGIHEARRRIPQRVDANKPLRGSLSHKLAVGTAGGVLPGLLGIGTGGIMVPAFTLLFRMPIKIAIGCSLTCFAANALVSSTSQESRERSD